MPKHHLMEKQIETVLAKGIQHTTVLFCLGVMQQVGCNNPTYCTIERKKSYGLLFPVFSE